MLDQLSNYPSPTPDSAKSMMFSEISYNYKTYKYRNISKDYLKKVISDIVDEMQPFGSEAAWYVHHIPHIKHETEVRVEKMYQKINKVKFLIRIIGKLMKIYLDTLEKMYHPDSQFVTDCTLKYKNVFSDNKSSTTRKSNSKIDNYTYLSIDDIDIKI
tara:strand:- start:1739 stop:2212 length:474 start_codon:yes stop_codon:yes gene_type:complete